MGSGGSMAQGMGGERKPARHGVQILFPYPKRADRMSITLCNYADRTYFYKGGKKGSEKVAVPSVGVGEACMSIPLDQACKDEVCWERGAVAPCETRSCFLNSAKAVTAGISVVSSGQGSAVCTVVCTASKAECKTTTAVYIAPAHCAYVQVLPSAVDLVEFPAPYDSMAKVVFPYPTKWKPGPGSSTRKLSPTTISICNWGYEDYWFSTGDSTDEAWKHGAGHVLVKPIGRGTDGCVVVNAEQLSWKRGYIAPCPSGEASCARILAQEVHAGVNVVNPTEAGQALCNVECASDASVCKTTTVILISPVKCDKVHVATM
uniref:Uncharacterized protein n=1 Tax=Guillardia theta TaxID=55529 RepID=A0A7S4HBQ3_GUITH|mmetsp:Transcript_13407/g.46732  ORF Transcript_13407/g.46732 Transcript_13407/m.46732 type:complete len:319 (+) Transcript_13407:2-958(+)